MAGITCNLYLQLVLLFVDKLLPGPRSLEVKSIVPSLCLSLYLRTEYLISSHTLIDPQHRHHVQPPSQCPCLQAPVLAGEIEPLALQEHCREGCQVSCSRHLIDSRVRGISHSHTGSAGSQGPSFLDRSPPERMLGAGFLLNAERKRRLPVHRTKVPSALSLQRRRSLRRHCHSCPF